MTRLEFWRDLKWAFEILPEPCHGLRAEWNPKGQAFEDFSPTELSNQWEIFDGEPRAQRTVICLAQRAARGLGFNDEHDSAAFWFEKLRLRRSDHGYLQVRVSKGDTVELIVRYRQGSGVTL